MKSIALLCPCLFLGTMSWGDQPFDADVLREWKVFLYVDETKVDLADLLSMPAAMAGEGEASVAPVSARADENGWIDLESLAGGRHTRACAILCAEVTVDAPTRLKVGTSADWWMEWRVNGEPVLTTLDFGNNRFYNPPDRNKLLDYVIELPLKKGKNLVAAKVLAGSGAWFLYAGRDAAVEQAAVTTYKPLADYADKPLEFVHCEDSVPAYELPDLLTSKTGQPITNVATWESVRRREILDDFNTSIYGAIPTAYDGIEYQTMETVEDSLDRLAVRNEIMITVTHAGKTFAFPLTLMVPKKAQGPVPLFLVINGRSFVGKDLDVHDPLWPVQRIIERGFATASFDRTVLALDDKDAYDRGVLALYPEQSHRPDGGRTISAWAYGAMRCVDYLLTDARIDPDGIAVVGHSRGGKTALWVAANDPRFFMACVNNSGCLGAALSRRKMGQTLSNINNYAPHWFNENCHACRDENDLPVDQHMLMALVAPRYLCLGESVGDPEADPMGSYEALVAADPVYALYGKRDMATEEKPVMDVPVFGDGREFHIKNGSHSLTAFDWDCYMDAAAQFHRIQNGR